MVEPDDVRGSSVVLSSLDRIAHAWGYLGPIPVASRYDTDETQLNWAVAGLTGRTQRPRSEPVSSRMSHRCRANDAVEFFPCQVSQL